MSRRAVAAAIAVLLGLTLVAGCSSGKAGYGSSTKSVFLASCDPQRDASRGQVCQCAYDEITQHYAYADYSSIDADLKADPNRKLPDELMQLISECAVRTAFGASSASSASSSSSSSR